MHGLLLKVASLPERMQFAVEAGGKANPDPEREQARRRGRARCHSDRDPMAVLRLARQRPRSWRWGWVNCTDPIYLIGSHSFYVVKAGHHFTPPPITPRSISYPLADGSTPHGNRLCVRLIMYKGNLISWHRHSRDGESNPNEKSQAILSCSIPCVGNGSVARFRFGLRTRRARNAPGLERGLADDRRDGLRPRDRRRRGAGPPLQAYGSILRITTSGKPSMNVTSRFGIRACFRIR